MTLTAETEGRSVRTSHPAHDAKALGDLKRLARLIARKDRGTAAHCGRLRDLARAVGLELRLPPSGLYRLDYGAYLHDLGKVEVPDCVLQKPGRLTLGEWALVKRHPTVGRRLLETTFMAPVGVIVEQHHEKLDGSGYPHGLSGDAILTESYIVAVVDTFDAMTTDRPYRRALPFEEALTEIRGLAGRHYPREVVDAFFAVVSPVNRVNRLVLLGGGLERG